MSLEKALKALDEDVLLDDAEQAALAGAKSGTATAQDWDDLGNALCQRARESDTDAERGMFLDLGHELLDLSEAMEQRT